MRQTSTRYRDRTDAGQQLAEAMQDFQGRDDVVVLGLPRGGVPVAAEVAEALDAPLDVIIVRKLGVPGQPELAMGAVASKGVRVMNEEIVRQLGISQEEIDRVAQRQREEVEAREKRFGVDGGPDVEDAVVILVDDGIATGSTMKASIEALRQLNAAEIVVAVPVASSSACAETEAVADDVICLNTPRPFSAVGAWYDDFTQTTDEDVVRLLEAARRN